MSYFADMKVSYVGVRIYMQIAGFVHKVHLYHAYSILNIISYGASRVLPFDNPSAL